MATIFIDNQPHDVHDGENLLHALPLARASTCRTSAGIRRWDRSAPAGSAPSSSSGTRQDTHGKLVMACMTPAADGTRISIDDPEAREFRAERHRVADGEPPARLPGLRRGRRVPPAGHDGDDRPRLPALPRSTSARSATRISARS